MTRKAVRIYEARGLVGPAARSPAGYRLFSDGNVDTLPFIRRARRLGLGLTTSPRSSPSAAAAPPPGSWVRARHA